MDYSNLVDFDRRNGRKKKDDKKDNGRKDNSRRSETRRRSRSRSPPQKVELMKEEEEEEVINYNIPSREFGDLFCVVCDSHMNSEQMWENHITGKRHLKNSRKGDTAEQKYEYSSEEPTIQKELDKEAPIAGLEHICEIVRINQPPIYQCFLCSASLTTSKLLIEHLLGLKHQMAFLREHAKEKIAMVDAASLSKAALEPIIRDLMVKYEEDHGRGKMSVKKEKPKLGCFSYKRNNDGDKRPMPKSAKHPSSSKSSRYSPSTSRYSPPSTSSRYSSPSTSSRYSPPPKSSRYSPAKSSRYAPPSKSSRFSPPPKASQYSPPPKSARMKERLSDAEWQKVPPVRERSRETLYTEREYTDEERWPSVEPEPTAYRRATMDAPDSSHPWPPLDDKKKCSDLRLIIEQKKSLGMGTAKSNMDLPAPLPVTPLPSTEIKSVSDKLLTLVNDMSAEVFLSLAVFKLGNMDVKEDIELKLLDRVAEKATLLARDARKRFQTPDLKAKFQEAMAENGLSPKNNSMVETAFTQNLDNFIGHFKSRKTTARDDANSQGVYSSHSTSSEQFLDNKSSHHPSNTSSAYRNAPGSSSTYDSAWNQRQSTALPFQSFSSTPAYIPGLEMVRDLPEESPPQPSTPMSQFAQAAQSIFGKINVPSTSTSSFKNEDYNRLNYHY